MAIFVIPADIAKSPGPWGFWFSRLQRNGNVMASINHPRLYDVAAMAAIKAAFNDVWEVVEAHAPLWDAKMNSKPRSSAGSLISLRRAQLAERF
jgi:hypothetical protein